MYRDVKQGLGVFDSLIRIVFKGFDLPWLTILERMGHFPNEASVTPLLVICEAILWTLWKMGAPVITDA